MFTQPYSDDYMIFDERKCRYVLTEKALTDLCAIDLRARMTETATLNPETVIQRVVNTVSDIVYYYMHSHTMNPKRLNQMIAFSPESREVIQEAMCHQAIYMGANGDLFLSAAETDTGKEISQMCKMALLNGGLLYTGV